MIAFLKGICPALWCGSENVFEDEDNYFFPLKKCPSILSARDQVKKKKMHPGPYVPNAYVCLVRRKPGQGNASSDWHLELRASTPQCPAKEGPR